MSNNFIDFYYAFSTLFITEDLIGQIQDILICDGMIEVSKNRKSLIERELKDSELTFRYRSF